MIVPFDLYIIIVLYICINLNLINRLILIVSFEVLFKMPPIMIIIPRLSNVVYLFENDL